MILIPFFICTFCDDYKSHAMKHSSYSMSTIQRNAFILNFNASASSPTIVTARMGIINMSVW